MKRTLLLLALLILAGAYAYAQQELYTRTVIPLPKTGFSGAIGGVIAGVDLDGNGKTEIYMINSDVNDTPDELVPILYKYEWNATKSTWDSVWSATLPIPLQNTWPALTVGDLDGDGRQEIIWGPVNNMDAASNPNPPRVFVFESVPGQSYLGISDGKGGYVANATFKISDIVTAGLGEEIRPFRFVMAKFGGKNCIVFADRQASYHYGVISVNKIGNTAADTAGTVWTLMTSGKGKKAAAATIYDIAVVDSTIFAINSDALGTIYPITYANGVFTERTPIASLVPGGSWKSSQTIDINNDGKKEIVVAAFTAPPKVYLLQKTNDSTLTSSLIADFTNLMTATGRLYGGAVGDIDGDGKPDFIYGSRAGVPTGQVVRLSYKGGDATLPASYAKSSIDRGFAAGRFGVTALANVDGKAGDEPIWTDDYPAAAAIPLSILSGGKAASNVTFIANVATVPDTLKSNSSVQIRGSAAQLTWGSDTPAKMTNKSGDYWQFTGLFVQGETIAYKFTTNAAKPAIDNLGWENDITQWGNGNRQLIVGASDTTLPLQFVNGSPIKQPLQYWKPYTPSTDSVAVLFRVNVQNEENFNPATMQIGVRGGTAPLDWGKTFQLTQESMHGESGSASLYNGTKFYSGWLKFPKSAVRDTIQYKYYITDPANGPLSWESVDNRILPRPVGDSTLYWKFWNNVTTKPPTGTDTSAVSFTANLLSAVNRNSFKLGDTVMVQFGWSNTATSITTDTMIRQGVSGYTYKSKTGMKVIGTKIDATGKTPLYYSYYRVTSGNAQKEIYYDFNFAGSDNTQAERRSVAVTSKTLVVNDTSTNLTNSRRMPFWRNQKQLARNVAVTVTCDLRPAYWQVSTGDTLTDIQGAFSITKADRANIWVWGVNINGPMTTGWATWGTTLGADTNRTMYDNGTHGDKVSGDHIYTRIVNLYKDSLQLGNNTVGQEFKFGIRGGDNEGGKGGYGNNHVENIDDSSPTATLDNQFGSINPNFYKNWNYDTKTAVTGVATADGLIPMVYSLEQNYPNPFNPTTTIKYSLPNAGKVMLTVYNVLGQEVLTLVNGTQNAGVYTATFDASRLASGMYIYRIEAGSFNAVKKMMLVK